jgi:hypothetical protein
MKCKWRRGCTLVADACDRNIRRSQFPSHDLLSGATGKVLADENEWIDFP